MSDTSLDNNEENVDKSKAIRNNVIIGLVVIAVAVLIVLSFL